LPKKKPLPPVGAICFSLLSFFPELFLPFYALTPKTGSSILTRIGYKPWICPTKAAYIETAVALAANPGALANIRSGLRERMANSPLCDGKFFTHALEQTYRDKWRAHVDKQISKSSYASGKEYQPRETMSGDGNRIGNGFGNGNGSGSGSGDMGSVPAGEDGPTSKSTVFRAPTPTEYASGFLTHTTNSNGS
jgi:hypothetical protein